MRLLTMTFLTGLALVTLDGCSEKQKEAANLEQEVKDLEATDSSAYQVMRAGGETDTSVQQIPGATGETAPGTSEESADPSALPPEVRRQVPPTAQSQATPGLPQTAQPKPPMPPAPSGGGFTVQIASSDSEDYARKLVDIYTDRGYQPFVTTITYNNQTYFRVRVGNFKSVAEAKVLLAELVDRFSIQPWIDRIE